MGGEGEVDYATNLSLSGGITAIEGVPDSGKKLVACSGDGTLHVFKDFDDDEPEAHTLSDNGLTLYCTKEKVFVGTEFHTVELINLEDGNNEGVKAKFAGAVNHLDVSQDGKWLVAGSGDMTIQIVNLEDSSVLPVKLETHSAPVLSVALDPQNEFLASSGCDGCVCIWSLNGDKTPKHLVKKLEQIFPKSNGIETSSTFCRLSWDPSGKILAVPEDGHVALYARESWAKLRALKTEKSQKLIYLTRFSKCGKYLAGASGDGTLIVWKIHDGSIVMEHRSNHTEPLTGLTFSNNDSDIVAASDKGRLHIIRNFLTSKPSSAKEEDGDDDGMDDLASPVSSPGSPTTPQSPKADEFDDGNDDLFMDDADDNEFSISKIKASTGFVDDEYVGVAKATKIVGGDVKPVDDENSNDSDVSSIRRPAPAPVAPPVKVVIPTTEPQKPFQPSSTPQHLDSRFMVWNCTGIIRNYALEDDDKDAIDIEFHNADHHHALHLRNQDDYTIACLSGAAAVFANEKSDDSGSKLWCHVFHTWDSKKEWTTELPKDEEIVGLAIGDGWIAASTDLNRIRLFTTSGVQRQIIEVGGQIISTSGYEDLLFIAFHNGIGLHGNQCIAHAIYKIKRNAKPFPLVSCEPLPITPRSQLTWIGFSDEGTPLCADSKHVLRILCGRYWTTFCSMKDQLLKGSSDNFWVVGVSELDQKIRAVKCKGMKYPPTVPRPVVMQLEAKLPLCEMETEKSKLEDRHHRSLILESLAKKMEKMKGYDVDEYRAKAEKELKESLFNLFVMSCNGSWDVRGADYVSMMPTAHAIQVAVKFANKRGKQVLVNRLTEIGRQKVVEEEDPLEGDDDDFETVKIGTMVYTNVQNRTAVGDSSMLSVDFNSSSMSMSSPFPGANRSIPSIPVEENPFMKKNVEEIRKLLGSSDSSGNRFRKEKPKPDSGESADGGKGLSKIDSWKKPMEKPTDLFTKTVANKFAKGKKGAADKNKDQGNPKEKKKQATLLDMGRRSKDVVANSEESNDASEIQVEDSEPMVHSESLLDESVVASEPEKPAPPKKVGFQLWMEENKEALQKEFPNREFDEEFIKLAMTKFKQLSPEEKKKYTATKQSEKRKRNEVEEENGPTPEGEKKSKLSSKLSAFARPAED